MRTSNLLLFVRKMCVKPLLILPQKNYFINYCKYLPVQRNLSMSSIRNVRIIRDDVDSDNEVDFEYESKPSYRLEMEGYARDLLQITSGDVLFSHIYNCVSLQELFGVLKKNKYKYKSIHFTQSVLVLYDLKRIYDDINHLNISYSTTTSKEFLEKLEAHDDFKDLLALIGRKINHFDANLLSYVLLYLNKLGMNIENPLLQLMSQKLEDKLLDNFSLSPASRFLEAIFSELQLRSYFMSQSLIPSVLNEIENCNPETLHDLTVALNKLHNCVTVEELDKYKEKVEKFISDGLITSDDYKIILQIIAFLNYPKWRDLNSVLISKCILLIKDNLNLLNVDEILLLYEIFFKIQEPGGILSELQRSSSRHYHQLDDLITSQKIKLFSTIVYFASPNLRNEFQKILHLYVKNCNDFDNLLLLRKLLSHIKISDTKLCQLYWDKLLKFLKTDSTNIDMLKLCQNYLNFTVDIENFRHKEFEHEILEQLKKLTNDVNYRFFPQKLANMLSFVLIFGTDKNHLEFLVNNLEENWGQLRQVDCLKLSSSLRIFNGIEKKYIKLGHAQRIDRTLNKLIAKEMGNCEDLWKHNALLKSCIFKNNAPTELLDKLLNNYKNFHHLASKNIENISYCFHVTNALIPEVLDRIIEYMITHKDYILGFNTSKVVYLLYNFAYNPKHSNKFFNVVANIITRDQERMTGLSLIQCALGLCFFNKLPNSLIKSIFNIEFMDKLDVELQNCYSKDKYPQRVRLSLMQLNRAVCLDYPECNIPWFHQKYVDEIAKTKDDKSNVFAGKVREYLLKTVQGKGTVQENVFTPYGYKVDFVINLDSTSRMLALQLVPDFYYTRMCVNLKGPYQLKKRHLEMLGYKVVMLNFKEWIDLFYAGERIEFLTNLIWPEDR